MAQQSSSRKDVSVDRDHTVAVFPTRSATYVPPVFPGRHGPAVTAQGAQKTTVRTHVLRRVVVLEVSGRLSDVIEDLERAILPALADGPRGVVCDLSLVFEGAEASAVEVLASLGRHVRDWPGIPVAVSCPDARVRQALRADPVGGQLIVTASMLTAVSTVLATPIPAVESLYLIPHPTAPRAARNFVARILPAWGLDALVPWAALVVSELVTNSTIHAGTDIVLSVAWNLDALRLTVRDECPDLPRQWYSQSDLNGRGLSIVSGLSRADGFLPTADGGKVVWAVLNASR